MKPTLEEMSFEYTSWKSGSIRIDFTCDRGFAVQIAYPMNNDHVASALIALARVIAEDPYLDCDEDSPSQPTTQKA